MYEAVPIPEMNEALAVFDCWEKDIAPNEDYYNHNKAWGVGTLYSVPSYRPQGMKYHSSMDWLWPVWIKIQNTGADTGITFKPYHIAFHVAIDHGDILAAHRACFDFIKRYNEINNEKENNKRSHL